jgi:multidrug transporter EmrE-like cation transporter
MNIFLLIIIVSIIEYFGDSNFKIFARENKKKALLMGILMYAVMIAVLIVIIKRTNITYMNGMWDGTSAVIETLLAYILLHETLSNKIQYLGLVFIISGIIAMNYGVIPK